MSKFNFNTILYRVMMIIMVVIVLSIAPLKAFADIDDDIDDLTGDRDETQEQLNEAYQSIEELAAEQESVDSEIDATSGALVQLIAEIEVIEEMISDKEAEIVVATENYNAAVERENEQYDSMKIRIKYLYESGGTDLVSLYVETGSISDALTKADYAQDLYVYDRQMLADYKNTVNEVKTLREDLEIEKEELVAMQEEYEEEQANMEAVIEELKSISDSYAVELSAARNQAAKYAEQLKAQNKEIKRLQDEKKAQEEAERKAAEEKARKEAEEKARKEAEEKARREEEKKAEDSSESNNEAEESSDDQNKDDSDKDPSSDEGVKDNSDEENKEENKEEEKQPDVDEEARDKAQEEADKNQKYDVSSIYNAKGSKLGKDIAATGCKYIGNPYVPGGTSLTNGADCSGFVYSLYKSFGYTVPRTSYSLRSAGREVSYADAEPGDVICYTGHVAIYLGNGMIVHASTIKTGIKVSNAQYRPILCVRRII